MTNTRRGVSTGLEVSSLEVRYGTVVAVGKTSFLVEPGTAMAVTGVSGAGKSSLLWALAGASTPHGGTVRLDETPITDRQHAAYLGIGIVPQGNGLATTLTARENILIPLVSRGVKATDACHRTTRSLVAVGLEDSGDHLIEELSGGQQQRIAVARVLAAQCTVVLADEPTGELDEANRRRVVAALRHEAEAGAVVVIATNDPETAATLDSELILEEGVTRWR